VSNVKRYTPADHVQQLQSNIHNIQRAQWKRETAQKNDVSNGRCWPHKHILPLYLFETIGTNRKNQATSPSLDHHCWWRPWPRESILRLHCRWQPVVPFEWSLLRRAHPTTCLKYGWSKETRCQSPDRSGVSHHRRFLKIPHNNYGNIKNKVSISIRRCQE
jgi:hypothetical protein